MWLIFASFVVVVALEAPNRDFMFPEDPHIEGVLTGGGPEPTERVPIYAPGECPENMLLYPGDGDKSAWICDCNIGYLYFPLNNSCHEPYRQGPCAPHHYVVLPLGEVIPKCERNPCMEDGLVSFNNTCTRVKSTMGPCPTNEVLVVNSTTFQLECNPTVIVDWHIIDAPPNRCPNGSRRNALGQCRKMI